MTWFTGVLVLILLSEALLNVHIYNVVRKNDALPGSRSFGYLCIAIAIYTFGYGMELASNNLETAFFWNGFQYIGIPLIYFFGMTMALRYTRRDQLLSDKRVMGVLMSLPILVFLFRMTNDWHHQYYTVAEMRQIGPLYVLHLEKGILYFLSMAYMSSSAIIALLVYMLALLGVSPHYRKRVLIMVTATLLPWATTYFNITNLAPLGIDFSALMMTVTSVMFYVGIFQLKLFESAPISREHFFHYTQDGIVIVDWTGRVVDFNAAAKSIFGQILDSGGEVQFKELDPQFEALLTAEKAIEIEIKTGEGSKFYSTSMTTIEQKGQKSTGMIVLMSDITSLVETRTKLEQMAAADPLTGADNRRAFYQKLDYDFQLLKRYERPFSLLMLDIDHFKKVNDEYGHLGGDYVLIQLVKLLKNTLRGTDTVGRFGGEEFVVLLPETDRDQALKLAERVRLEVERQKFDYEGRRIGITISIGVCCCKHLPEGVDTVDLFLQHADDALYQAKRSGRNRSVLFDAKSVHKD